MTTRMRWLILVLLAIAPMGCVAQGKADRLDTLYRRALEQNEELKARLEEANARIRALEGSTRPADPDTLAQLEALRAERDVLAKQLADLEERVRNMPGVGPLDPVLDRALAELAAANPDLMEYDSSRGMVKFRSDLTFALGSATVNDRAKATLTRLAQIINSPVAQQYEARIVGHTDNVPISQPATRQAHPTNWHLSAHRAIAVKDVLEQSGVAPARMAVVGHSQFRPVVPNAVVGGRARGAEANRRVEIYMVPMPSNLPAEAAVAEPAAPAPAPAPAPAERPELFK